MLRTPACVVLHLLVGFILDQEALPVSGIPPRPRSDESPIPVRCRISSRLGCPNLLVGPIPDSPIELLLHARKPMRFQTSLLTHPYHPSVR